MQNNIIRRVLTGAKNRKGKLLRKTRNDGIAHCSDGSVRKAYERVKEDVGVCERTVED